MAHACVTLCLTLTGQNGIRIRVHQGRMTNRHGQTQCDAGMCHGSQPSPHDLPRWPDFENQKHFHFQLRSPNTRWIKNGGTSWTSRRNCTEPFVRILIAHLELITGADCIECSPSIMCSQVFFSDAHKYKRFFCSFTPRRRCFKACLCVTRIDQDYYKKVIVKVAQ